MRRPNACAYVAIVVGLAVSQAVGQDRPAAAAADQANDLKAIRDTAQAYVAAFNRQDAKAIAALWAENGDCIDDSGKRFQGRAEIEKVYAELFRQHPGGKINVIVDSLRLLSPDAA